MSCKQKCNISSVIYDEYLTWEMLVLFFNVMIYECSVQHTHSSLPRDAGSLSRDASLPAGVKQIAPIPRGKGAGFYSSV